MIVEICYVANSHVYNWTRSKLILSTTVKSITTEVTKQAIQYYITGILFSGR